VATDCGAVPEVVVNENLIVPQKSIEALYMALRELIENTEYRLYLTKANRMRAKRLFDIEKQRSIVNNTLSILT
jgi:glycosyltransferase involved in cell wall biosynthesis